MAKPQKVQLFFFLFFLFTFCLMTSSQSVENGNRWVWKHIGNRPSDQESFFNPFSDITRPSPPSVSSDHLGQSGRKTSPRSFHRNSDLLRQFENHRSVNEQSQLAAHLNKNLFEVSERLVPGVRNSNLQSNHFSNSGHLSQQLPVVTPTSNHLPSDSDTLLISSYSSLDANPHIVENVGQKRSIGIHSKSLLDHNLSPNSNVLGPIDIKPLPIDISTLPLESNERAEGLKKLWSSIMTRNEFVELFQSLTNRPSNVRNTTTTTTTTNQPSRITTNSNSVTRQPTRKSFVQVSNPGLPSNGGQQQPSIIQQQIEIQRRQQQLLQQRQQQQRLRQKLKETGSLSSSSFTHTTRFPALRPNTFEDRDRNLPSPSAIQFFNLNQPRSSSILHNNNDNSQSSDQSPSSSQVIQSSSNSLTPTTTFDLSETTSSDFFQNVAETSLHFPNRQNAFIVEKLRLPGNDVANVVFIPSTSDSSNILETEDALAFFRESQVQAAIKSFNNKDMVFVVEEISDGSNKNYIITTVEGKRVYPRDTSLGKGLNEADSEDLTRENSNRRDRSFTASSGDPGSDSDLFLPSPSTLPLTITRFPPNQPFVSPHSRQLSSFNVARNFRVDSSSRKGKSLTRSDLAAKSPFSPVDEFDPDSFNPFVPQFASRRSDDFREEQDSDSNTPERSGHVLESRGFSGDAPWPWKRSDTS